MNHIRGVDLQRRRTLNCENRYPSFIEVESNSRIAENG